MRLTRYTDYSLRVLIYLGIQPTNNLVSIKEIAEAYSISNNHLVKVVYQLGQLGLVHTIRGRQGGIKLALAPSQINIGQVVRQTEEELDIVECFDEEKNTCIITHACALKHVLRKALDAYLQVLDSYTLEDLIHNKGSLHSLFQQAQEDKSST